MAAAGQVKSQWIVWEGKDSDWRPAYRAGVTWGSASSLRIPPDSNSRLGTGTAAGSGHTAGALGSRGSGL